NVSINNAGTGYTLTASATTLTGATSSSFSITAPITGPQPTRLSSGSESTCAVTTSRAAYCWGSNVFGQLGIPISLPLSSAIPVAVSGGLSFATVSVGSEFTCGVTTGAAAY